MTARDRWSGLLLIATLTLSPAPMMAQADSAGHVTMTGHVLSDKTPVGDASITVFGFPASATTDDRGSFRLPGLPTGDYMVSVRRVGFTPTIFSISVAPKRDNDFEIDIKPAPTRLAEQLVVANRYAGLPNRFSEMGERLDKGLSRVIASDQFQQYPSVPFALRQLLPSRFLVGSGSGRNCLDVSIENAFPIASNTLRGNQMQWNVGSSYPVPISILSAIEYIPPEFAQQVFPGRRSTCGLVVLWY